MNSWWIGDVPELYIYINPFVADMGYVRIVYIINSLVVDRGYARMVYVFE